MGGQIKYVRERIKIWRSIERIINTEEYKTLYDHADKETRSKLDSAIITGQLNEFRKTIKAVQQKSLDHQSLYDLRVLASSYGIKNYNNLPKKRLCYLIRQRRLHEDRSITP